MALQFLVPIIASVLYFIVFQKAGFKGAILAVCAAPVLGSVIIAIMIRALASVGGGMMMLVPLISIPLSLAPLLVLAFKSWPPVGVAPNVSSES